MVCERCGKEFFEDYRKEKRGICRFCSRSCACSRVFTEDTKNKISSSLKKYSLENKREDESEETKERRKKGIEKAKKFLKKKQKNFDKNLLEEDFNSLSFDRLKRRVLLEQDFKCNVCGLTDWNGKAIVLELEHKDGNNQNNVRENVECICPNCHSQTSTFRGRNRADRKTRVYCSDEVFVETFLIEGNIRRTLLKLGYAAKGANYGRVKRALTLSGIDYKDKID